MSNGPDHTDSPGPAPDSRTGAAAGKGPAASAERILVGAITGAFGVKGEVRLKSFCATPASIADYGPLWTSDGTRSFRLRLTRPVPNGFAGRIADVGTRDAAEALRGTELYADRSRLPSLPDDEFYHADLIGLEVFDTGGAALGRVRAVLNHGAGDILEIHRPGARQTQLLPFTLACVPTVDLASGRIIADPPLEDDGRPEDADAADDGSPEPDTGAAG